MTSPNAYVAEFHETYGVPIKDKPEIASNRQELRIDLIREEFRELLDAIDDKDIVEVADALADLVYVIYGTALEFGIPLDDVIKEVHRSNMSKLGSDGKPMYREDGKVLKGPGFFQPDIQGVLFPKERDMIETHRKLTEVMRERFCDSSVLVSIETRDESTFYVIVFRGEAKVRFLVGKNADDYLLYVTLPNTALSMLVEGRI